MPRVVWFCAHCVDEVIVLPGGIPRQLGRKPDTSRRVWYLGVHLFSLQIGICPRVLSGLFRPVTIGYIPGCTCFNVDDAQMCRSKCEIPVLGTFRPDFRHHLGRLGFLPRSTGRAAATRDLGHAHCD